MSVFKSKNITTNALLIVAVSTVVILVSLLLILAQRNHITRAKCNSKLEKAINQINANQNKEALKTLDSERDYCLSAHKVNKKTPQASSEKIYAIKYEFAYAQVLYLNDQKEGAYHYAKISLDAYSRSLTSTERSQVQASQINANNMFNIIDIVHPPPIDPINILR